MSCVSCPGASKTSVGSGGRDQSFAALFSHIPCPAKLVIQRTVPTQDGGSLRHERETAFNTRSPFQIYTLSSVRTHVNQAKGGSGETGPQKVLPNVIDYIFSDLNVKGLAWDKISKVSAQKRRCVPERRPKSHQQPCVSGTQWCRRMYQHGARRKQPSMRVGHSSFTTDVAHVCYVHCIALESSVIAFQFVH